MCIECQELIKAIDAYIAKADEKLSDTLKNEGFAQPEETVKHIEELEEQLAEVFGEQSAEVEKILKEAEENGVELEEVIETSWSDFKSSDDVKKKLYRIFFGKFSEYIPVLANVYMSELDSELVVNQITARTTGWISAWSYDLSELMELSSHEEIESLLSNALKKGKSVAELTQSILESGIRDEYYKARRAAITEILRAHSVAKEESIRQCPATEEKEWVHTGSYRNKPRENHVRINGQVVPKDQPFTLVGKDGITYYPKYPRAANLPPSESVNCHCTHRGIVSKEILGLSLEERKRLQQQAIDEMDDEWLKEIDNENKKRAGINEDTIKCDWLWNNKTVEERKKYFKSDSRWALFESGVIQNDADLERLYKTVSTEKGIRKTFKSLTELKEDGIITVPADTLKHSVYGNFTNLKNPKKPPSLDNGGRPEGGGHSQLGINELNLMGWEYNIEKVFENGVKVGNIPAHKQKFKKTGIGQSWFPENWDSDEILKAGTYVANSFDKDGITIFGEYNGVRVGVYVDEADYPSTIFPDNSRQP